MTSEELEKRVTALEDLEEIKKLHRKYVFFLHDWQWDKMIDCFANDAVVEIAGHHVRRGKDEYIKTFKEELAERVTNKGGQVLIEPVINVEGDKAKGHWIMYLFFPTMESNTGAYYWQGRYDCEYVKQDGKWKFSSLRYERPWPKQPVKE